MTLITKSEELMAVSVRQGVELAAIEAKVLLGYLEGRIAKWWMPDAVEFVESIPHTATGKIQKVTLRERFRGYRLA